MEQCYGTSPEDLMAVICPSIGIDRFETDGDVLEAFQNSFGILTEDKSLVYKKKNKYHISVSGFVYRTLLAVGLKSEHIFYDTRCTYEEDTLFFSHRRDKGNTGAMSAVIATRSGV